MRMVQWQVFPEEMVTLERYRSHPDKSSSLYELSPTLDEYGVMLGGLELHLMHRLTLNIRLRAVVRQVAAACQWCIVKKATPKVPRMAPLPVVRLSSFTRPFTYTGIDLFGPLLVKVGRSVAKRWICLFTCLTIRAVHVEVVPTLTTSSCVKSIRQFVCRRGSPAEIYSDNGTNFQGAERLLREQLTNIQNELAETFTNSHTKWVFIPPAAPHMGGAWERMVRSIKSAMQIAYNNNQKLDDEGLQTMVIEAERNRQQPTFHISSTGL
ncbi:uncharacterized protein LOC129720484 [Wyeomyia smithii]|uniref:uncharacterized protein LOC129720484 n=1 Tax=Wyeomyia smithii TaxID=174621 RepID=UPI002467D5D7|nr:uncharacterized protein LOC129720484 [Wyeomyia smithii]